MSGQTFEHNPHFWITFAEIARVLVPGGVGLIVAPGGGAVHRYPVDCWRFYPDSWAALCALTGLELVESYFETDDMAAHVSGGNWRDSAAIVRKPVLDEGSATAFQERLRLIVELFRREPVPVHQASLVPGKWVSAYRQEMQHRSPPTARKLLKKRLAGSLARIHS